jgi:putative tricarboxylic transport membrane protein
MRVRILIEGILLGAIGLISVIEGVRLIIFKNPVISYDPVGPSFYVLLFGIALMFVGCLYIILNYRNPLSEKQIVVDKGLRIRLIGTVAACALYVLLINILGYLVATFIFLFIEFKIANVKAWPQGFILSMAVTAFLYLVFVEYCSMIFPRGIIFR